ncbi:MAG: TlyA family RNA methyltransferase [Deltaproteobacteria bacterium]|nr:TlyA family RNA methyltransferase [Deltaproteobacteria bacterium]
MAGAKERADELLARLGLADSRSQARALIMAGRVYAGPMRIEKPGTPLAPTAALRVVQPCRYVSRGGEKLEHALRVFAAHGLSARDKICVDVGASTGGFTDCLLQHGAARVFAVDVGRGQLHPRLRADARVVVRERTNARSLCAADFPLPLDLVVVDVSFIGLGQLASALASMVRPQGELVVLVKPQFEAGRAAASRGRGVIRDEAVREQAVARALAALGQAGFALVAQVDSPLRGPKGNLERLAYLRKG